jgi:hypothetical protein
MSSPSLIVLLCLSQVLSPLLKFSSLFIGLSPNRVRKGDILLASSFCRNQKKKPLVISPPDTGDRKKEMGKNLFFSRWGNLGLCSLAIVLGLSRIVDPLVRFFSESISDFDN